MHNAWSVGLSVPHIRGALVGCLDRHCFRCNVKLLHLRAAVSPVWRGAINRTNFRDEFSKAEVKCSKFQAIPLAIPDWHTLVKSGWGITYMAHKLVRNASVTRLLKYGYRAQYFQFSLTFCNIKLLILSLMSLDLSVVCLDLTLLRLPIGLNNHSA